MKMKTILLISLIILNIQTYDSNFERILHKFAKNKLLQNRPIELGMKGTFEDIENTLNIPLKQIDYEVEINTGIARVQINQLYKNEHRDNAIDTEYFFAINPKATFVELSIQIGEKILVGYIKAKESAQQEYDQAVNQGHKAIIAEIVEEVHDVMKLKIGNLGSNEEVKVTLVYLELLDISINEFWKFSLGNTFSSRSTGDQPLSSDMQNVCNPPVTEKEAYYYNLKLKLNNHHEIKQIKSTSHPDMEIKKINSYQYELELNKEIPNKEFVLLYSSVFEVSSVLGEIPSSYEEFDFPYAAYLTFIPEFNSQLEDERQDGVRVEFLILVDRSGSMDGNKIIMTKEVLNELLDHLPSNTYFNIISFGDNYQFLFEQSVPVSDVNLNLAKQKISEFNADMGGTEIYQPLKEILSKPRLPTYDKVIFLISDGQVSNENLVIALLRQYPEVRVSTIGIGNAVSKNLIMEAAIESQGKYEFVSDLDFLKQKIFYLLEDSTTPFLEGFSIEYDKELVKFTEKMDRVKLRKNDIFQFFCLIGPELTKTQLKLHYYDSVRNENITKIIEINKDTAIPTAIIHQLSVHKLLRNKLNDLIYTLKSFKELEDDLEYDIIFDYEEYDKIQDDEEYQMLKNYSIKFQILTELSAMIVVDKDDKIKKGEISENIRIPLIQSQDYISNFQSELISFDPNELQEYNLRMNIMLFDSDYLDINDKENEVDKEQEDKFDNGGEEDTEVKQFKENALEKKDQGDTQKQNDILNEDNQIRKNILKQNDEVQEFIKLSETLEPLDLQERIWMTKESFEWIIILDSLMIVLLFIY